MLWQIYRIAAEKLEPGIYKSLAMIHEYLFGEIHDLALKSIDKEYH